MKFRNAGIYLFTALLALTALFLGGLESEGQIPFSFSAVTEAGEEEILFWEKDGEAFVFLPGFVEPDQLRLVSGGPVLFDDLALDHGDSCGELEFDRAYALSGGKDLPETLTFLRSGNVAALYIDTVSGSMDHIHEAKEKEESGTLRLYDAGGRLDYAGNLEAMNMRGNNLAILDKVPYSLKLFAEGDLLGMGRAKKWILLSDAKDPTHLRNKLVFDFARQAGLPFSPESRWVDLYLNGEYAGLYLLCERNEVHPRRVAPEGETFLVSAELEGRLIDQDLPYIRTRAGVPLRIRYSDLEKDKMEEIFRAAENAIFAEDGMDPQSGKHWSELIDLDSWARKYLIEEVFGNVDGGLVSQFFYLDGGRIHAGPVWDYDMAMANPQIYVELVHNDYGELVPNVFYVNQKPENWGSPWFYRLYQDPVFREYMEEVYERDFLPLLKALAEETIPREGDLVYPAARMDAVRWGEQDAREQTDKLAAYLRQRSDFLTGVWLEDRETVTVVSHCFWRITNYILEPGQLLPQLPMMEPYVWYDSERDTPVDFTKPVTGDLDIYLKRESTENEEAVEEIWEEEAPEEPLSLMRLGPGLLFAGMLVLVWVLDLLGRKKAPEKRDDTRTKV